MMYFLFITETDQLPIEHERKSFPGIILMKDIIFEHEPKFMTSVKIVSR